MTKYEEAYKAKYLNANPKYHKLDLSPYKHRWIMEAWQIEHPIQYRWDEFKFSIRKAIMPIAHRLGLALIQYGIVKQQDEKNIIAHAQMRELQELRRKLSRKHIENSVWERKHS